MLSEMSVELVCAVRKRFSERFEKFHLDDRDWARLEFGFKLATGSSVIDVGTGHGVLLHMLADSGGFKFIRGLDVRIHSQAMLRPDVEYICGSITDESIALPISDTVICMEVIEHLEEKFNSIALNNLRRATIQRLVLTVPFEEPEPVWWHDRPGGHRQSFNLEKLARLFPNAFAARFPRHGVDWVFVVEDRKQPAKKFSMISYGQMLDQFACN